MGRLSFYLLLMKALRAACLLTAVKVRIDNTRSTRFEVDSDRAGFLLDGIPPGTFFQCGFGLVRSPARWFPGHR
jgi:hypothetical protein